MEHQNWQFTERENADDGYGKIASMTYKPNNWNGSTYYAGIERWRWMIRRAAFNAAERDYFGLDVVEGAVHLYAETNPRKINGAIGWIDLSTHPDFHLMSTEIATQIMIQGKPYFIRWPTKVMWQTPDGKLFTTEAEGLKQVRVCVMGERPWAKLMSEGGNWLSVALEQADKKTGVYPGNELHHIMGLIAEGSAVNVPVTNTKYFPEVGGEEYVWLDRLQRKAEWLKRNIEVDGYDYDGHRAAWLEDRINTASTFGYMKQAGIERAGKDYEQNNELLQERREGRESGLLVTVDGNSVDAATVQPGYYSVHDRFGKLVRARVTVRGLAGAGVVRGVVANGHNLKTITVFEA